MIIGYLFSCGVILTTHKEIIDSEKGNTNKCLKFLTILPKRGSKAFDLFIAALNEVGLKHVAEKLSMMSELSDYPYSALVSESTDVVDNIAVVPTAENAATTEAYQETRYRKGYVVPIGPLNAEAEALFSVFTQKGYPVQRNNDYAVANGNDIPIVLILCPLNDDIEQLVTHLFTDKNALIFATSDIAVQGCYTFIAASPDDIVTKLHAFFGTQHGSFPVTRLMNELGFGGSHNLANMFHFEWPM